MKESEFKKIKDFHGHLGPYAVTGYIIGQLAKKYFKDLEKITYQGPLRPPYSCLIDGLQLSSGCTVGRGEIGLRKAPKIKITLQAGNKRVKIDLNKDFEKKARENFGRNMRTFARNLQPAMERFF